MAEGLSKGDLFRVKRFIVRMKWVVVDIACLTVKDVILTVFEFNRIPVERGI